MQPHILVTGLGITTCLGRGADANWRALRAGRSGLKPVRGVDLAAYAIRSGGEAPALDGEADRSRGGATDLDRRDRAQAYLRDACHQALRDAGFSPPRVPAPRRAALVLGSSLAAQASATRFWQTFLAEGVAGADYRALRSYDLELRLAALAAELGVEGEALLVSNACAAGASAIALAADLIRLGRADLAVVAGYDAFDLHTHAGFGAIQALTPDTVRPFTRDRAGMLLGDGFAALVLERADGARPRGRRPLAVLAGYGESADAHHLTQPHPEGHGAALAMRRALEMAGLAPAAIDHVNVHGTGTSSNDVAEARAMRAVFGERLGELPLSALKPFVGHTLGGAGAVEAALTLLALRHQTTPPALPVDGGPGERGDAVTNAPAPADLELDPEVGGLDLPRTARPARLRHVMSNAFGFGGCNASLIFTAPDDDQDGRGDEARLEEGS